MITIFLKKNKTFSHNSDHCYSQDDYDCMIEHVPFHRLSCTCGRKSNLVKHGYYKRSIKSSMTSEKIKFLRVKCTSCGKTHAILPAWVVPYSQIPFQDHLNIIKAHLSAAAFKGIMQAKPCIDESNIQYLVLQFKKHWKERLTAFKIPLSEGLCEKCFRIFGRQFMQIKCTPNILFS